jgi:hypothetical protein
VPYWAKKRGQGGNMQSPQIYTDRIYTDRFVCYNEAKRTKERGRMATTKASQKAVSKSVAAHYDRIHATVPKGEKERLKAAAEAQELRVNG